jgi:hypothetical protein
VLKGLADYHRSTTWATLGGSYFWPSIVSGCMPHEHASTPLLLPTNGTVALNLPKSLLLFATHEHWRTPCDHRMLVSTILHSHQIERCVIIRFVSMREANIHEKTFSDVQWARRINTVLILMSRSCLASVPSLSDNVVFLSSFVSGSTTCAW